MSHTHDQHAPQYGGIPASRCDDGCVATGHRVRQTRTTCRGIALAVVLVLALMTAPLLVLFRTPARYLWLQTVAHAALAAAGVTVRVRDLRPEHGVSDQAITSGGALLVANHLSWIDVLALQATTPVRLVAKKEVSSWPLIGTIAAAAGAVFIDRRALHALPAAVADVTAALRAGSVVAAFPEGTTWCGRAAGPFRHAVFQAALDAGVPVRPVAVALRCGGTVAYEAAFVGEQPFLDSVRRVLRVPALVCELTLLPSLDPVGTRAQLASRAGAAIGRATGVPHPSPRARARVSHGVRSMPIDPRFGRLCTEQRSAQRDVPALTTLRSSPCPG